MGRGVFVIPFLLIVAMAYNHNVYARAKASNAAINRRGSGIYPEKLALPGVVVVKLKPGVVASIQELLKVPELEGKILREANPQSVQSLARAPRIRLEKSSEPLSNIYFLNYSGTVTPAMVAQSLLKNPDIIYAEPHYIYKVTKTEVTPNDSLRSQQYALTNIQAYQAWNITQGDPTVSIAIVDIGVNWMHPDLYGNIWHNLNWQSDTSADSIGWDFGGNNGFGDSNPAEDFPPPSEHGTHVAGIAAAVTNNHIGIAGTAPKCKIMAVKTSRADMTDPSSGDPYIIYGFEGIIYAADKGARVINCSWGGVGYVQYEQDVINQATQEGALVVVAAGNDHSDEFETPAYYDNVLSVAATDENDNATYFTNYSYNVSVSAPGLDIISTWGTNSYQLESGTSMASPCAAGVAALVVSQHPEYTPQQVMEQVRVSADNIDAINSTYVHLLGFGRVNAYRALTVTSPGVLFSDIMLSDSAGGNNDGTLSDGETIQVFGTLTDWLAPTSNLQVTLTTSDPYVTIVNGSATIGALATKGTYDLRNSPLSFKIKNGVPTGHVAQFLVLINDGSYSDYKGFTALFDPTFNQLTVNNIATTITARGNIGFNDFPNDAEGVGFIYLPDSDSLLFEGAFMAGTSATKEVDVARDSSGQVESADFNPDGMVEVKTPGVTADQEATTAFNDSGAASNRVGIDVSLHTYSYKRDSTGNFIILEYTIHNLKSAAINNFYAGLFLDWDIGLEGANNIVKYDGNYQLGYAYNMDGTPKTYTGCALIDGASPTFTAIDNADQNTGTYVGFNKARKWDALSGQTGITSVGPADISMVVSGGPVSIQPNSNAKLVFALVAGEGLQDLRKAVNVARELYGIPANVTPTPAVPKFTRLNQNYPNPFNPTTNITFDLSADSRVTVDVYNVIGEKVATLTDHDYQAGYNHALTFSANSLASGIYFVRLTAVSRAQTYVQTRKMVVLK